MMNRLQGLIGYGLLMVWSFSVWAEPSVALERGYFTPADATQVNWLFSGRVVTESGDQLAYFFQMERNGTHYHSVAALFDVQTQAMLFQDESDAQLVQTGGYRWSVGHAVLRFNPINASWVFGVTTPQKQGFHFKMDMLDVEKPLIAEDLRPGLSLLASQTHALNGHVRLSSLHEEQFVLAQHAWFRQIWLTSSSFEHHAVHSLLCHLDDGSSLHSVRLPEADAVKGAMAGLWNEAGLSTPISQFIDIQSLPIGWDIRVPATSMHLLLSQYTRHNGLIVGFAQDKGSGAFCLLAQDELGSNIADLPTV